jgi:hypothetical protein
MGYGPSRQNRGAGNSGEQIVQFKLADAQRIADVVSTVEGSRRGRTGSSLTRDVYASPHYLSKTTAAWAKNTKSILTLYSGTPGSEVKSTGDTVEAWNKWGDVASGEWVLLGRANGTFYLAKGPDGGIKRGTFTAPWGKGTTTSVSDAVTSGTTYPDVKNYFANITGSGLKACAIAYVGTEWILIAAEC